MHDTQLPVVVSPWAYMQVGLKMHQVSNYNKSRQVWSRQDLISEMTLHMLPILSHPCLRVMHPQ
mgnify:CR=1 FL=1